MRSDTHSTREAGFALIAVLIVGGFLALLAATMARAAHTEGATTRNLALAAAARAAADGAVRAAIFDLLTGDGASLPRDGSERGIRIGEAEISLSVQDATGLLDLNTAVPELLAGLFAVESGSPPLASALVSEVLRRRAPASGVAAAARRPANPFRSVAELAASAAMPVALYRRLAPLLTVYSRQAGIDPLTAPHEILLALPGSDPGAVAALLAARADYPAAPRQLLPQAARFFVDSPRDAVQIVATANAGGVVAERRAIVRILHGARPPYRILEWQPGPS
jgi:general secretion pathway protein K